MRKDCPISIIILLLLFIAFHTNADTLEEYKHGKRSYLDLYDSAIVSIENNNIEKANKYFCDYFQEFQLINSIEKSILEYIEIGQLFKNKLFYANAIDYYLKALGLSEENGTNIYHGKIFNRIGDVHYDQNNYSEAMNYYVKSRNFYQSKTDDRGLAIAYNNIGEILRFTHKYVEAFDNYSKSVVLNLNDSNYSALANNYNNIGLVYIELGKYEQAKEYLFKCKILLESYGDDEKKAAINISIGYFYYSLKDYSNAIEYFKKTIETSFTGSEREVIVKRDCYEGLYKSYSAVDDFKNAYLNYLKYSELNSLIFNIKTGQEMVEIRYKNRLDKQQSEISLLKEIVLLENRRKTTLNILLGVSVFLILILAYAFLLIKKSLKQKTSLFEQHKKVNRLELEKKEMQNQKLLLENRQLEDQQKIDTLNQINLEEKLHHKKQELSLSTLNTINKNEILLKVRESINELKVKRGSEAVPYIVNVIDEIDNSMNLDKDWENFKLHFENVHQEFFKQLLNTYPELTSDELKMCAYLKINLTSKEIAQILNISAVAINKRRNRLRKKLNLSPDNDLIKFFTEEKYE